MTSEEANAINRAEFEAESRAALERALAYSASKRREEQEKLAALGMIKSQPLNQKSNQPENELCVFRPGRFANRHEAFGMSKTLPEWCRQFDINMSTVLYRLRRGYRLEDALRAVQSSRVGAQLHCIGTERHTLDEWAEIKGINRRTLNTRLRAGLTLEEALTRPIHRTGRKGRGRVEAPAPGGKTGGVPSAQESLELEVFT